MRTLYGTWSHHSCTVMGPSPITPSFHHVEFHHAFHHARPPRVFRPSDPTGGPPMSRAVVYETFGGPEVLELRDVPEPHAGPGEVRVRVTAAGLNPMDWGLAARPEAAAQFGITLPSGFGYDFAGVVDEAGRGFAVGDRVHGGALGR